MPLSETEKCWWIRPDNALDEEDPKAHEKLRRVVENICRDQDRKRDFLLYGSMYAGGLPPAGGGLAVDNYVRSTPGVGGAKLSLNVSRNVVDAVCARVFSKSKPRVSVSTIGGGFEKQDMAQKLELGIDGAMRCTNYYEKSVAKGRDSCVFGTGFTRIRPNYDCSDVDVLRMMPWEVIFDDGEAMTDGGTLWDGPRCIYLRYYIDRFVLMHRAGVHVTPGRNWYADGDESVIAYKLDMLEKLKGLSDKDAEFGFQQVANRVCIEEGWHRPSGKNAKDGRYVVAVENCTLIDRHIERYEKELSWYRWGDPIVGFYGQGIVEQGSGIQAEINKLIRDIQTGHHLIKGHYLVEQGSKVVKSHINNDIASILNYVGTAPTFQAPSIISPEVYQHLWALVQKYYELAGVNQQSASAQRPVGLDSGEAQRVYADQQTETLLEKGKRFEEAVQEDGMLIAKAAKCLSRHGVYEVRTQADDGFESIDWKDLEDPDEFAMYVETTSALPGTLPGKLSTAQDLMQIGQFAPQDVLEMVGMADLLQITKRKQASRKLVEKKVGEMLRGEGKYMPHPFLNLAEAIEIATEMRNVAEVKDVDDEYLRWVQDFVDECKRLMKPPAPMPGPMGPGAGAGLAGGPPMGIPGALPMPTAGGPPAPGAPMPPPGANGVMPT